jgi:NAD-dependent SIR2 family protein deacetylase
LLKECVECGRDFDPNHPEKKRAGGLITHCAECASETAVKHLGLQSADGKMAGVTILAFESSADREKYRRMWWNNSGMNKGKACQLGHHLSPDPGVRFKKLYEAGLGVNHKGKK